MHKNIILIGSLTRLKDLKLNEATTKFGFTICYNFHLYFFIYRINYQNRITF
jgi:hypothetical protein